MTAISLKMPEALLREVEEAAASPGVPKSAIIRESVESAMRMRRKRKPKVSCLDLIGDLGGHFEGPPEPISEQEEVFGGNPVGWL